SHAKCACNSTLSSPTLFYFPLHDTATSDIYTLSLHDALPISIMDPQASSVPPVICMPPTTTASDTMQISPGPTFKPPVTMPVTVPLHSVEAWAGLDTASTSPITVTTTKVSPNRFIASSLHF